MKKILLLIVTASILSCGTTSKLSNDDLDLFSGKWQFSCYSSISEPEYKECTITENTHQFVINENTGKSQIEYLRAWDGFTKTFRVQQDLSELPQKRKKNRGNARA